MNKILLTLMMINSMIFFMMKTPITMGFLLLSQTVMMTLISGMMSFNFWYAYILFLIMLGGMLILFMYISSLSSNMKFSFNKKIMFIYLMTVLLVFLMITKMKVYLNYNLDISTLFNMTQEQNFLLKMSLNKLYNKPTNFIMIMLINYLLLSLFIAVKITNINMGPLRKNF